jgi:hypothetical protein
VRRDRCGEADAHLEAKFPESQRAGDTAGCLQARAPLRQPSLLDRMGDGG